MAFFDRFIETRWAYAALALLVAVLALPGLFAMPAMDRDESRFSQATSQMLESGDYVVIRYHEGLRNKKPVGIHWMQAAAVALTSSAEAREIAAFRLPSLFGGMLAAMATLWGGSALFSRRAAFIGAAILGSCLLLSSEAHIAKTDAAQCGFLTLGMAALAHMRGGSGRKGENNRLGFLFWICIAIGVLLKGPIAPMVAGLTIAGLFLWERKYAWARPLLFWPGISLFCIMTIPWFVATQIATGGQFLYEAAQVDLGQKLVGAAEGHKGLPGQHLLGLPILFWPGTLLLIPGVWLAVSSLMGGKGATKGKGATTTLDQEAAAWRFVACWLVPSWLVFEIAPTKLFHYTLPMYPAFALMAGAAVDRWFSTNDWKQGRWLSLALFVVVGVLLAVVASPWALDAARTSAAHRFGPALSDRVAFDWKQAWNATGVGVWPTLLILAATAGTAYAVWRKQPLGMLGGLLACSLLTGVLYRTVVLPNQSWTLSTNASLAALKDICALPEDSAEWKKSGCTGRAPKVVRAISYYEPSLVFELGGKIKLAGESKAALPPINEDNRPAWLINASEKEGKAALKALAQAAADADRCIRYSRRYVMNYSNGDPSILVAAVVEPAGCPSSSLPPDLRPAQDVTPELDK